MNYAVRVRTSDGWQDLALTGPAGPEGPQGPVGPAGPSSSVPGPAGPKGDTGAAGAASTVPGPQGPQGSTGAQGPTGPTGAQGVKGDTGSTGPQGATGPEGPQGAAGTGINVKGQVPTVGDLPPTGNTDGDAYIVTATGDMWIWDAGTSAYINAGPIQGPAGPAGPQGIQGTPGPQGDPGATGATGATGAQGITGAAGAQGIPGPQGPQGDPGIQGPIGNTGAPGATGSQGPKGDTGSQGIPGTPGATGATGAQGPIGNTGAQGIQGPQGDPGDPGATGATGAQGPIGPQGATGPQGPGDVNGPASAVADHIAVYNGTTGKLIKDGGATVASLAPLASPVFTGDPQAPTPTAGDSDTSIATTGFVANAVGAIGVGGMSTAEYTFSTTTTAPPATGQLRGNNATQSAITAFYLHETNAVGVDITNALKIIAAGVKVLVQDKTNSANVQYYQTSGPAVDNGAYFTIPVTWTATGSGTPFTAGRVIFAGFGIGSNNMPEAPTDGSIYGRRGSDTSWQAAVSTTRTLTAGAGLGGGGTLAADRTFDVGAGTGITVNTDNVALTVPVAIANGGTGTTTGISAATQTALDGKLNDTGDTMTGVLAITNTTQSTSILTGAFTVVGGAGIAGNLCIGGGVNTNLKGAFNVGYAGLSQHGAIMRTSGEPCNAFLFENAASAALVGGISCTSTGVAYNVTSDERLKEDLKSFDAGNIVDNTEVYDFAWKSTGERAFGVLAQQANEVYPTAVRHDETQDWWGIDYSKYVPVLLQEMKALRARVAELETVAGLRPTTPEGKPS